jgi:hypothetical protein
MIISNPTPNTIEVTIAGVHYKVLGNSELKGVPVDAARFWKEQLHQFIQILDEGKVKELKEEVEKKVEEIKKK